MHLVGSYEYEMYEYCAFDILFSKEACNLNKLITNRWHLSFNSQPLLHVSVIICSHFQGASVCTGRCVQHYLTALSHCTPFCGMCAVLNMLSSSSVLEIDTFRVLQRSNNYGNWPLFWVCISWHSEVTVVRAPSLLCIGYKLALPGVKRPGRGIDHPLPSSAEVKEKVELYSTPPLGLRGLF